ncbi:hypothetical protein ASE36_01740 [Rhizobium sp. Root274]|uniref:hypothetical protein n=1 Tax=unclassified Rhizobium TaxID=2613769 RepID=UPI0007153E84|nr:MULTISPECIES: hypothetical protein [unclassified Rhizobium]KQW31040.1 hypothetical protein ASC71_01740 [Rhizobium sp. Root1240]KRD32588.1 hypothetical protein ASE36_01740 [Rhizobium sp. Root274]
MTISSRVRLICLTGALALSVTSLPLSWPSPALALSDIKDITPAPPEQDPPSTPAPAPGEDEVLSDEAFPVIPDPDPLIKPSNTDESDAATPQEPAPEVIYDLQKAPEPVRRMRQLIMDAAASGDIQALKPLIDVGPNQTQVPLQTSDQDPIAALKGLSGDDEGQEILAILLDILSTGFVQLDKGTPDEAYVWPYFAGKSLALLTPRERVELLRIVTAGDVAEMQEQGNYNFFRVGISPDGKWKFFAVGD